MTRRSIALAALVVAVTAWTNAPSANGGKASGTGTKITHADVAEAARLIEGKRVAVLDVRTPKETAAGRIAGATLLDFLDPEFEQKLGTLDRDKTWLVLCASGGRSTKALAAFRRLGFKAVVHLDGGFNAWQKDGKAVEK